MLALVEDLLAESVTVPLDDSADPRNAGSGKYILLGTWGRI
jgi:hypothetical protein